MVTTNHKKEIFTLLPLTLTFLWHLLCWQAASQRWQLLEIDEDLLFSEELCKGASPQEH